MLVVLIFPMNFLHISYYGVTFIFIQEDKFNQQALINILLVMHSIF